MESIGETLNLHSMICFHIFNQKMSKQTYKPTELEVKYLQVLGYANPTKINTTLRKLISIFIE